MSIKPVRRQFTSSLFAVLTLALSLSSTAGRADQINAKITDEGALVYSGDRPILFYQRQTKSLDGRWPRAGYVHPLYGLDGQTLTEDFPIDHRHHRGIFWAWHQLWVGDKMLGDPWLCQDFASEVVRLDLDRRDDQALDLQAALHWKSSHHVDEADQMIPVVREQTTITIHRAKERYRCIDFDIALRALVDDVRIGGSDDAKGYGGFSPRLVLDPSQQFRSQSGPVSPTRLAIEAGPWIDIRNPHWGITMLTHAENPGAHGNWILRRSRSMQNAVYPGRQPSPISKTTSTRLRYRLIVHDGNLAEEQIQNCLSEFDGTAK